MRRGAAVALPLAVVTLAPLAAGCGSSTAAPAPARPGVIRVAASENFWGSIATQLGGTHAEVSSIITNPNTDPHAYEPTPADAELLAGAQMVILNGVGYDPWATRLLAADSGDRRVLEVGSLLGLRRGDNPHRWYNPADVQTVIGAMVADYSQLDPPDAAYFSAQRARFDDVALHPYGHLLAQIRANYSGVPVGASESIFSMLAPSLGLDLITPPTFLRAISEGADVSAADEATIDRQIRSHQIKIYVHNSQNTTPDVQAQLAECRSAGIPTPTITETLTPATATYQDWQTHQLQGILAALQQAVHP